MRIERLEHESIFEYVSRVLGFLNNHASSGSQNVQQAGASRSALWEGQPQDVCRLLDESEDIAEEYSKPCGCVTEAIAAEYHASFGKSPISELQVSGQEIYRKAHGQSGDTNPAPIIFCDTVLAANKYGALVCGASAIGVCKHCEQIVCAQCLKFDLCLSANSDRHEVVTN